MWESLGSYDQIFRGLLIGSMFGVAVIVGYWLVARVMSKHVEQLETALGHRTDQSD